MSGLPWYRCYPRDFNEGMVGLTMEERGAYVTILNIIYSKGGPIDDDAGYFRALLCCSAKGWTKVRAALIIKRKLFQIVVNGEPCLMNRRAAEEIAISEEKLERVSEGGRRGGLRTQARTKKNNNLGQANLEAGLSYTDTDTDTDTDREDANASFVVSASPKPTQADDVRVAFDGWNDLASRIGLPRALKLDDARRKAIRSRLADGGLDAWRTALIAVEASAHCRGENDRNWRADLDFVCQARSWRRLLEGSYGTGIPPPKMTGGLLAAAARAEGRRMFMERLEGEDGQGNQHPDSDGDRGVVLSLSDARALSGRT